MKIVVVNSGPDVIDYLKAQPVLQHCLFVHYNHPLKALDNLAEIDPDLILWNADDYLRHWKLCAAFCPARTSGEAAALILVCENGLDEEEQKKAQALDIADVVEDGFFGDSLLLILDRRLAQANHTGKSDRGVSPAYLVRDPAEWPQGPGTLLLVHPEIRQLVIGEIIDSDGRSLSVEFENAADQALFASEMYIEHATIAIGEKSREAMLKTIASENPGRIRFLILHLAA